MSENIKVAVRVRPRIPSEIKKGLLECWKCRDDNTVYLLNDQQEETHTFDHTFSSEHSNDDVYVIVQPIVKAAAQGINGSVFAYGQSSSGKTHTILGSNGDDGIVTLAIYDLFDLIEKASNRKYLIRANFLEVYNEKVNDLFDPEGRDLTVREDYDGAFSVAAKEVIARTRKELCDALVRGIRSRHVGETNKNEKSSRSHVIFKIIIESSELCAEVTDPVQVSNLYFIDLAGSERASQTKTTGARFKEGTLINKSLSTLSLVIRQLSEKKAFVSYRDSKLTQLLKNALGANSKTLIIANITPVSLEDSQSTIGFAKFASSIKLTPKVNKVLTDSALIKKLQKKEGLLLAELKEMKEKNISMELQNSEKESRIGELEAQISVIQKEYVTVHISKPSKPPPRRHTLGSIRPTSHSLSHLPILPLVKEEESTDDVFNSSNTSTSTTTGCLSSQPTFFDADYWKNMYDGLNESYNAQKEFFEAEMMYRNEELHEQIVQVQNENDAIRKQNEEFRIAVAELEIKLESAQKRFSTREKELVEKSKSDVESEFINHLKHNITQLERDLQAREFVCYELQTDKEELLQKNHDLDNKNVELQADFNAHIQGFYRDLSCLQSIFLPKSESELANTNVDELIDKVRKLHADKQQMDTDFNQILLENKRLLKELSTVKEERDDFAAQITNGKEASEDIQSLMYECNMNQLNNKEFNEEIDKSNAKQTELVDELAKLSSEKEALQQECVKLNSEKKQLEDDNNILSTEIKTLSEGCTALSDTNKKLEETNNKLVEDSLSNEGCFMKLNDEKLQLEDDNLNLHNENAALQDINTKLDTDNKKLTEELQKVESEKDRLVIEKENVEKNLELAMENLHTQEVENLQLTEKIRSYVEENKQLGDDFDEAKRKLEEEHTEYAKQLANTEQQLLEHISNVDTCKLYENTKLLQNKCMSLSSELSDLKYNYGIETAKLQDLNEKNVKLNEDKCTLAEQLVKAEQQLNENSILLKELKEENTSLQQKCDSATEKLLEDNSKLENEKAELNNQLERLQKSLSEAENSAQMISEQNKKLSERINELEEQMLIENGKSEKVEQELRHEIDEMTKKMFADNKLLQDEILELNTNLDKAKLKVTKHEKTIQQLTDDCKNLVELEQRLDEEMVKHNKQLIELREDRDAALNDFKSMQSVNVELTEQLTKTKLQFEAEKEKLLKEWSANNKQEETSVPTDDEISRKLLSQYKLLHDENFELSNQLAELKKQSDDEKDIIIKRLTENIDALKNDVQKTQEHYLHKLHQERSEHAKIVSALKQELAEENKVTKKLLDDFSILQGENQALSNQLQIVQAERETAKLIEAEKVKNPENPVLPRVLDTELVEVRMQLAERGNELERISSSASQDISKLTNDYKKVIQILQAEKHELEIKLRETGQCDKCKEHETNIADLEQKLNQAISDDDRFTILKRDIIGYFNQRIQDQKHEVLQQVETEIEKIKKVYKNEKKFNAQEVSDAVENAASKLNEMFGKTILALEMNELDLLACKRLMEEIKVLEKNNMDLVKKMMDEQREHIVIQCHLTKNIQNLQSDIGKLTADLETATGQIEYLKVYETSFKAVCDSTSTAGPQVNIESAKLYQIKEEIKRLNVIIERLLFDQRLSQEEVKQAQLEKVAIRKEMEQTKMSLNHMHRANESKIATLKEEIIQLRFNLECANHQQQKMEYSQNKVNEIVNSQEVKLLLHQDGSDIVFLYNLIIKTIPYVTPEWLRIVSDSMFTYGNKIIMQLLALRDEKTKALQEQLEAIKNATNQNKFILSKVTNIELATKLTESIRKNSALAVQIGNNLNTLIVQYRNPDYDEKTTPNQDTIKAQWNDILTIKNTIVKLWDLFLHTEQLDIEVKAVYINVQQQEAIEELMKKSHESEYVKRLVGINDQVESTMNSFEKLKSENSQLRFIMETQKADAIRIEENYNSELRLLKFEKKLLQENQRQFGAGSSRSSPMLSSPSTPNQSRDSDERDIRFKEYQEKTKARRELVRNVRRSISACEDCFQLKADLETKIVVLTEEISQNKIKIQKLEEELKEALGKIPDQEYSVLLQKYSALKGLTSLRHIKLNELREAIQNENYVIENENNDKKIYIYKMGTSKTD